MAVGYPLEFTDIIDLLEHFFDLWPCEGCLLEGGQLLCRSEPGFTRRVHTIDEAEDPLSHRGGCRGLPHGEEHADILGGIGYPVLDSEELQDIPAVDRHEERFREVVPDIVLDQIRTVFQLADLCIYLFGPLPIAIHEGLEERPDQDDGIVDSLGVLRERSER